MDENEIQRLLKNSQVRHFGAKGTCPDLTVIAAYSEGRLGNGDAHGIEQHLADCPVCLKQVAHLAKSPEGDNGQMVPEQLVSRARKLFPEEKGYRMPLARWAAVAAAAAIAIVSVSLWFPKSTGPEQELTSPYRSLHPVEEAPIPEVTLPENAARLVRDEMSFRWEPTPRSLYYELVLVTEEGDLIWQERFEDTSGSLPENVELVPGAKYYVWVRAHLPEGKALKSHAVHFIFEGTR
jgi:hypothetical protein